MKPKVEIRKIDSYRLDVISSAIEVFLGSARLSRLDNARTVLIKPNLLGDFAPEKAVTTHPIVLEAIIRYLLERGKEVWQTTGMADLAERYPVKLINLSANGVQEVNINGCPLRISKVLWQVDTVISVSKYKTHSMMAYTGALKNLYGLVPGMIKTEYHKTYPDNISFGHMIASLHKAVRHRVVYHIMDGIVGMDGAGPSAGNPRNFGLLFGSASAPALDYLASKYMGFTLSQVDYLREVLHDDGILPSQIEYPVSFNNYMIPSVDIRTAGMSSKAMQYVPGFGKYLLKKLFEFHPFITDECKACMICVKSCPMQTIKVGFEGRPAVLTENCINCMCCHEMCPHHAIIIKKSPLAKLLTGRN